MNAPMESRTEGTIVGYGCEIVATCRVVIPALGLDVAVPVYFAAKGGVHKLIPDLKPALDEIQHAQDRGGQPPVAE